MRVGGTTLSLGALVVSAILIIPQAAAAIPANHVTAHYTVAATIGERRVVVVDPNQTILAVYSNTDDDIAPTVRLMTEEGPAAAMTPTIQARYDSLIGQLKANRVVIITKVTNTLTSTELSITRPTTTDFFNVAPTHVAADPDPSPYQVSLTQ